MIINPYVFGGSGPSGTWDPANMGAEISLSGSNLVATTSGAGSSTVRGTSGRASGSGVWQFEVTVGGSGDRMRVGLQASAGSLSQPLGADEHGWGYIGFANKVSSNSFSAYGATYASGDVIGVIWDAAAAELTFYKNGTSQGLAFSGLSGTFYPAFAIDTAAVVVGTLNVGATAFAHAVGGATAWG